MLQTVLCTVTWALMRWDTVVFWEQHFWCFGVLKGWRTAKVSRCVLDDLDAFLCPIEQEFSIHQAPFEAVLVEATIVLQDVRLTSISFV